MNDRPLSLARRAPPSENNALLQLMRPLRGLALRLVAFSGIINLMTLAVSLYMMQVYDRVLTSQSKDTLFFLTFAVVLGIALGSALDAVRQLAASRAASWMSRQLGSTLLIRTLEQRFQAPSTRMQALREMGRIKSFLSTPTAFNIVDMLWVPLYLLVVFLLHPLFALISLLGAMTLFGLTWHNERTTRNTIRQNQSLSNSNLQYAECLIRNGEVIEAMGMAENTVAHWSRGFDEETVAADRTQEFSSRIVILSKLARNLIQIVLLASGALLVLNLDLTAGAMVAGSLIVARLLAPIEGSISYWKQFVLARDSLQRLRSFLDLPPTRPSDMTLPAPAGHIASGGLTYVPPGSKAPILRGVNFNLAAGSMLVIVGPSASGKTTLSRMIVGILKPTAGRVLLDGADTFDWKRSDFGRYVGYLPQDVELLPGTVRDNIARFRPEASDADVVAAARMADCHNLILQLDGGYDHMLTEGGQQLSGGQRQRIGLARALFGTPRLVVLDEPNASLDAQGDAALASTLANLKAHKVTTVVVSHRTNLLQLADRVLVLQDGRVTNFGNAKDVMDELTNGKNRRAQVSGQQTAKPLINPANKPAEEVSE